MRHVTFSAILCLILGAAPGAAHAADDADFKPLFNGKNFDGFTQRGGKAKYTIETIEGVPTIVGKSVPNTPNSFMCTDRNYGDFILEYEFKVDEALNCGVQIRSNSIPTFKNGVVHGYQVEIDPDVKRNRMWTAGIYDESRRGWLNDLTNNEPARKAFKPGAWNKIRVEAVGDSIKTFLNGVPAADLVDSMTQTGFIGLQVHGVGKREDTLTVMYRNLRIKDLGQHVWKPIWDGKTFEGWETMTGGKWEIVEDKAGNYLHGTSAVSEKNHGMFIHKEKVKDFTLRLQAKILKGNSGVYYRVDKLKGGVNVAGFQAELDANNDVGGLYETNGRAWVSQPKPEDVKKWWKVGEWNEMTVSAHGTRIVVHVNGFKTAELMNDEKGRREGFLALQMHGGQEMEVMFKEIEVLVPSK
ncbi:MAG: DUF1080 domain-containing protein [Phycisphaeraceae bacterium]